MSLTRRLASAALGACLLVAVDAAPSTAATPAPRSVAPRTLTPPSPDQATAALDGAAWLASRFTPAGYIPSVQTPGSADLAATSNAVLALASAQGPAAPGATSVARAGLAYLEANVDATVQVSGVDAAGPLALLILDAHALGVDPHSFGGTDLVARLLATQQATGADAGLLGTQDPTYDGAYRQGLALAALAAAGVTGTAAVQHAETWLTGQQCPDGGWASYQPTLTCTVDPANYLGPDTNSTAIAVLGLGAQGALATVVNGSPLGFLELAQDADAGWGFEPHTPGTPDSTDPNSTALVVQALRALGQDPTGPAVTRGTATPVSTLRSFQLTTGADTGAFTFPGIPGPDLFATYQAVPALAGVILPFSSTTTTTSVSPAVAAAGRPVTLSASVTSPGAAPDGDVTFEVGGTALCSAPVTAGAAGCSPTGPLPPGADPVLAVFTGGDATGVSSGSTTLDVPGAGDYWAAAADGGVFAYGTAVFAGSHGGSPLNAPIVGMAATPDGKGYWLVAADGGVFAYGDAAFSGSHGGSPLNAPIVGMAATPDGRGYWLVAADGGIFAYGDAGFSGSHGGSPLNAPIVGMAATPDGHGYWLVAADGGIFAYGDAAYSGSHGGSPLNAPIVGMAAPPDGHGYWLAAADGGIFAYGDAGFAGAPASDHPAAPVVAVVSPPAGPPV